MKQAELMPYKFKDTGIEVLIRKVSPLLSMELQRAFPPPKPPTVMVEFGDGEKKAEENPADPDYILKLDEYRQEFEKKVRKLLFKRGVVVNMDDDAKAALADVRNFMREEYGIELDPDDHMAYISHVCIGSDEDASELLNAILRRSQPTDSAIGEAAASFRDKN